MLKALKKEESSSLLSPHNDFPSTYPFTHLTGYQSPVVFSVFRVEPDYTLLWDSLDTYRNTLGFVCLFCF
jgi:hypothetical protein